MRPNQLNILIVEDDLKVARALQFGLEKEGHGPVVAHTAAEAERQLAETAFDLVLLDLGLPDGDGLQLLTAMRRRGGEARVLVITARDALEARVWGLDAGADDYLVKPFAFAEVLARVRALARRSGAIRRPRMEAADLQMDVATRTVLRAGCAIDLTAREFTLLEYMLRFKGEIVTRDTLVRDVWQERHRSPTFDNIIDVHMARLRRKIDLDHPVRLLHTVRGVGFVLQERES
jgi:DNA-binding response OmpR family regulator